MSQVGESPPPGEQSLLRDAVDLHIHTSPDIFPRWRSAIEAARDAKAAGMGAIVVKSHSTDTSARAEVARDTVDFSVFGGVVLNYAVGGFNEFAVLETARQGGRIVWLPTIGARHFIEHLQFAAMLAGAVPPGVDGLVAVDEGRLRPEVQRVLDRVAEFGLTLASGHLAPSETAVVMAEAAARGIDRRIITHPHVPFVDMELDLMHDLAERGCFIEVTDHESLEERVRVIRTVGVTNCFLSTDGGTVSAPPPVDRLRSFAAGLLRHGFTAEEVHHMAVRVPSYLLRLPEHEVAPTMPTRADLSAADSRRGAD